jgi:hypothetical protein
MLLRDSGFSCATRCATTGRKPAPLRVLRVLREKFPPHACACVRARPHAWFHEKSRNTRNTRNHAGFTHAVAQHVAQHTHPSRNTTPMTQPDNVKKGRALMPETAALVDELRALWGVERVNAAIAAGQRARRDYQARVETQGQARADAWLRSQKFPQGCFGAVEGEHEVGVMR